MKRSWRGHIFIKRWVGLLLNVHKKEFLTFPDHAPSPYFDDLRPHSGKLLVASASRCFPSSRCGGWVVRADSSRSYFSLFYLSFHNGVPDLDVSINKRGFPPLGQTRAVFTFRARAVGAIWSRRSGGIKMCVSRARREELCPSVCSGS